LHTQAIPWLELHHVVLLKAKSQFADNTGIIAVDFSPFHQSPENLMRLFAGKCIPGEIRVRWIPNGSRFYNQLDTLKKTWCCIGPAADDEGAMGGLDGVDIVDFSTDAEEPAATASHSSIPAIASAATAAATIAATATATAAAAVTRPLCRGLEELSADELSDDYTQLVRLVARIKRKWDCNMNLYNHNCIHFADFVLKLARSDEVCAVGGLDLADGAVASASPSTPVAADVTASVVSA